MRSWSIDTLSVQGLRLTFPLFLPHESFHQWSCGVCTEDSFPRAFISMDATVPWTSLVVWQGLYMALLRLIVTVDSWCDPDVVQTPSTGWRTALGGRFHVAVTGPRRRMQDGFCLYCCCNVFPLTESCINGCLFILSNCVSQCCLITGTVVSVLQQTPPPAF